ncbi:MAG: hypothetical protein ACQET3_13095 [Promethearchaeati archaeon]
MNGEYSWFGIGSILGLAGTIILFIGDFYGIRYLRSKDSRKPRLSMLFLAAYKRKSTYFLYNIIELELPFIVLVVIALMTRSTYILGLLAAVWPLPIMMAAVAIQNTLVKKELREINPGHEKNTSSE